MDYEKIDDGWLKLHAPAKINLMLSVHGRRPDGFHELTSLVVPLEFGDELELRVNDLEVDTLVSEGVAVPADDSNLVLQAARLFRENSGRSECFDFRLNKRIPVGAGLGGGSSDAVAALQGVNSLLQTGISAEKLLELASRLGSDCPFFMDAVPSVIRGRGERVEAMNDRVSDRLSGQRIVLFRPDFSIDTGWAYRQLASSPDLYEDKASADLRLSRFYEGGSPGKLLYNQFEEAVGRKYLAIPCLLEKLRTSGYECMMSGSGSVCFAFIENDEMANTIKGICSDCWGWNIFWVETLLSRGKI